MVDASNRASGVVFDAAVYISEAMHVLRVVIVTFARDAPRLPGHHFNERVSDEIIQHHEAMFFCNNAQRRPGRPLSMPGKTEEGWREILDPIVAQRWWWKLRTQKSYPLGGGPFAGQL
jgi:hypothetical protein